MLNHLFLEKKIHNPCVFYSFLSNIHLKLKYDDINEMVEKERKYFTILMVISGKVKFQIIILLKTGLKRIPALNKNLLKFVSIVRHFSIA